MMKDNDRKTKEEKLRKVGCTEIMNICIYGCPTGKDVVYRNKFTCIDIYKECMRKKKR